MKGGGVLLWEESLRADQLPTINYSSNGGPFIQQKKTISILIRQYVNSLLLRQHFFFPIFLIYSLLLAYRIFDFSLMYFLLFIFHDQIIRSISDLNVAYTLQK